MFLSSPADLKRSISKAVHPDPCRSNTRDMAENYLKNILEMPKRKREGHSVVSFNRTL
jgi:hypothetical protein